METSYYCLLLLFGYMLTKYFFRKLQNLPPSPFPLPLIGHLHLFKKPLHRTLAKISKNHGQTVLLQFGSRRVLLVSSPSAAEECFTKNDIIFANRPKFLAGKYLGHNYTTLTWASYGPHWRNLRKIASLEMLSANRIHMFSGIRAEEIHALINRLWRGSYDGQFHIVEMKSAFFELTLNIMMRMIAGKRYYYDNSEELDKTRKFKEMVAETFEVSGATNIGDFLPVLSWLGVNGIEKRLKNLEEKRDGLTQELIDEHRRMRSDSSREQRGKTMIDVLLSLQELEPEYYTDDIIQGLMQNMLAAGTDTSAGTMEWALSILLNNPETLRKAHDQIRNRVGESRLIRDSDISDLPYLNGIINETLRIHPAAPLIPAHESSENCKVDGFQVPRGTMLLVNVWAIQNDPNIWENPSEFKPERFINVETEQDGFKLMPFGFGRRKCPGEGLAMRVIALTLGSLIQCFEWERVSDEMVDMSEGSGMTMPKAQSLVAKCRPRPNMMNLLSTMTTL